MRRERDRDDKTDGRDFGRTGATAGPYRIEARAPEDTPDTFAIRQALEALGRRVDEIRDLLLKQRTVRDWYSTAEVAEATGKDEFTVREWCCHGRIHAVKKASGRGKHKAWAVPHEELLRYHREGLLPARVAAQSVA
jgi:hypothetical protein